MMMMRNVVVSGWACGLMAVGSIVAAQETVPVVSGQRFTDVAVAPFVNLASTPSDDWMGLAFASALVVDLEIELTSAGDEARWLIRGSYQQVGTRLRITAGVVHTESGRLVHAVTLDGERSALFALQDDLSARLADVLAGGGAPPPQAVATAVCMGFCCALPCKEIRVLDGQKRTTRRFAHQQGAADAVG